MHGIGMYGHGVGVDRRRVVEGGKAISPTVQFLERREGEGGTRTCMSLLLCLRLLLVIGSLALPIAMMAGLGAYEQSFYSQHRPCHLMYAPHLGSHLG